MSKRLHIELSDMIAYLYQDTLLPEIFEVFGDEIGLKFLMIFGGTTISFPPYKKVVDLKRNLEIYNELEYGDDQDCIHKLAKKYGISDVWVRQVYAGCKESFEKIESFLRDRPEEFIKITTKRFPREEEEKR